MATTLFRDMAARIAAHAHAVTGGRAAGEDALCNYQGVNSKDITELTGTLEITLVHKTREACFISGGRFVPETAMTAHANSRDLIIEYDDGAGGSAVALCTEWIGIVSGGTDTVAGQVNEMTGVLSTVEIPAGSRIYFKSTHNGTGIAWDETSFEADLERA